MSFSVINWMDQVLRAWGDGWFKPEVAYEFTGRNFDDTGVSGGIYSRF